MNLKQTPLVTLMIPCYNQASIVHKAIESALAQTYPNLEVVISDDNSSDNTAEAIQKYLKDPRVRYFKNSPNLGRVQNYRKTIFEYSRGEWVLNIDGDDYLLDPEYIKKAMFLAMTDSQIALVFARMRWFDIKANTYHDSRGTAFSPVMNGNELLLRYWKIDEGISNLTALYKRQFAIDRDTHAVDHIFDDAEAFFRMIPGNKVGFVDTVAGCWLKHETNYSGSKDLEKRFRTFEMIEGPYHFYLEEKLMPKQDADIWRKNMLARLMREHVSFFIDVSGRGVAWDFFQMCKKKFGPQIAYKSLLSPRLLLRFLNPSLYSYLRQKFKRKAA